MGKWKYEGLDKAGKRVRGQIDASSEREARKLLRAQTIRPKKLVPPSILEFDLGEFLVDKGFAKPFGPKELSNFTKQLAIMINAGVPILQSLEILFKAEKHPVMKKAIKNIATDVGEGKTISETMEKQRGFDKLYCNLVKAGEAGGILDQILEKLNEHMDRSAKIKQQVKSALTYPVIVCIVGGAVVWGLMVFVVPKFVEMLESSGKKPPAITQFVMDVSAFLQEYTLTMLPIFFVGAALFNAWTKTPAGKYVFDRFAMRVPVFGGIIIKGNLSSFCRTLATLLNAGVSLIDSLDICIETIDNGVISKDLTEIRTQVTQGKTITEGLGKISYFPDMVCQMIKVGEQTGGLDNMLLKIADVFEDEVNILVTEMTKLIEPLIIVVLGGIVATILIAMYLPIFMSAGG